MKLPKKSVMIQWGSLGFLALVFLILVRIYFLNSSSLRNNIHALETKIAQADVLISVVGKLDSKKLEAELKELDHRLESSPRISDVLEELNRLGDENGVNFVSVEPSSSDPQKPITIRMEIDGTYEPLAKFLGTLDNLDTALARVQKFDLKVEGSILRMSLEIELYTSKVETAE